MPNKEEGDAVSSDESNALLELSKEFKRLLAATSLTTDGLAQRAGLGRTTVSQTLNGSQLPTERTVVSLARALGVKDPRPLLDLRDRAHGPSTGQNALRGHVGQLSIDDVIVEKEAGSVRLDVRVRNTGSSTINITRACVVILERVAYAGFYEASATYDLLISGERNSTAVAHALTAGEVDSFLLRLSFSRGNESCGFKAKLELTYNGGLIAEFGEFRFSST